MVIQGFNAIATEYHLILTLWRPG